jgi:hypothetical protein
MAEKLGERFAADMGQRGFRELGGFLYPDSNIAQPTYPIHGAAARDAPAANGPSLADRLQEPAPPEPPARDEPQRGIEIE